MADGFFRRCSAMVSRRIRVGGGCVSILTEKEESLLAHVWGYFFKSHVEVVKDLRRVSRKQEADNNKKQLSFHLHNTHIYWKSIDFSSRRRYMFTAA